MNGVSLSVAAAREASCGSRRAAHVQQADEPLGRDGCVYSRRASGMVPRSVLPDRGSSPSVTTSGVRSLFLAPLQERNELPLFPRAATSGRCS